MPSVQTTAPRSNTRGDSLADILERVLDTGIVIAGDIRVQLADIELLTIQIRLIICSVDKAQQLGMDWWKGASFLSSDPLPTPQAAEAPAAVEAAPRALGAEQPGTVADVQQHFTGASPQPAPAQTAPAQPAPPQAQPTQAPSWQQPSAPTAQQPWHSPPQSGPQWQPPQQQPPQQAWQQPTQPPAPQTAQQPAQQAAQRPAPGVSDVQAEMLNERLARLEAVLERLLPPEE